MVRRHASSLLGRAARCALASALLAGLLDASSAAASAQSSAKPGSHHKHKKVKQLPTVVADAATPFGQGFIPPAPGPTGPPTVSSIPPQNAGPYVQNYSWGPPASPTSPSSASQSVPPSGTVGEGSGGQTVGPAVDQNPGGIPGYNPSAPSGETPSSAPAPSSSASPSSTTPGAEISDALGAAGFLGGAGIGAWLASESGLMGTAAAAALPSAEAATGLAGALGLSEAAAVGLGGAGLAAPLLIPLGLAAALGLLGYQLFSGRLFKPSAPPPFPNPFAGLHLYLPIAFPFSPFPPAPQPPGVYPVYAPAIYVYDARPISVSIRVAHAFNLSGGARGGWTTTAVPFGAASTPLTYETELAGGAYGASAGWTIPASRWPSLSAQVLREAGFPVAAVAGFEQDWAHDLPPAPWYRVALVPHSVILATAPLRIDPAPRTIVRLWFDVTPISREGAPLPPPVIPRAARTTGLSVYEWGVFFTGGASAPCNPDTSTCASG